jgi:Glycosyltransferase
MALTTTGTAFYKDVLFIVLLRLFNIKRVYHLHNKGISLYQSQKLNYYLYRFVFNDADVILLSKYLRNDIQKFVTETHIHICPNGIASCAAEINYQHLKSGDPPIRILFLSNLIESKGVFVLLEACSILQKKGIPFQCVFIGGEGNVDASRFNEKVVLMGLSDRIVYRGIKYGEEKISAFAEADIFVFPTYYECFPLVLLEAMSASLPIVSTFEGGIPDIVEDGVTGFLVPQKNAELLADKLELLILNPSLRKEMGCAGRKKYESQFTLEHFEKNLCTILQKLTK